MNTSSTAADSSVSAVYYERYSQRRFIEGLWEDIVCHFFMTLAEIFPLFILTLSSSYIFPTNLFKSKPLLPMELTLRFREWFMNRWS